MQSLGRPYQKWGKLLLDSLKRCSDFSMTWLSETSDVPACPLQQQQQWQRLALNSSTMWKGEWFNNQMQKGKLRGGVTWINNQTACIAASYLILFCMGKEKSAKQKEKNATIFFAHRFWF